MTQVRNKPVTSARTTQASAKVLKPAPKPHASPKVAAARPGTLDRLLDPELFKALADPTRAALLACIARCRRPCAVSEVAECCSVDLSVVSRHLAQLARSGLLESRKSGRIVHYSARSSFIAKALRDLADEFDRCGPNGDCNGCC